MKKKIEITLPQGVEERDTPRRLSLKKKTSCTRCGECCRSGTPTLLKEDLALLTSGVLSHADVYTIREGELVQSGEGDEFYESIELVKIREKQGSDACIFYDAERGCTIYEQRPAQCRAYKCWDPAEVLSGGLEEQRLTRKELFDSVELLSEVIKRHEEKCSYKRLAEAFERVASGDEHAVEEIMDALQYDTYIRPFLEEKFSVPIDAMDLLLGRPVVAAIHAFGFEVVQEGDNYILKPLREGK